MRSLAALAATVTALVLCAAPRLAAQLSGPPRLLAWNDLGMHCMDPDMTVFVILPPFNTLNAQLILPTGLVTSDIGIVVTYEATLDATGSITTTSIGKTGFWDVEDDLFGVSLPVDVGLAGQAMPGPGNVPQPSDFDTLWAWYQAEGIPITPIDDAFETNTYPLMRLTARQNGQTLATTTTVAPVSTELECSLCHASGGHPLARPDAGWGFDPDPLVDDRWNILALHDDRQGEDPVFQAALATAGYDSAGLVATAQGGTAILCARCHVSNALPGTGLAGIAPLTQSIHGGHADVTDPQGLALDTSTSRNACFTCHPGQVTQCLRGAMGKAIAADGQQAMQCQSCHANMSAIADPQRVGWLDQPTCQSCHTGTALANTGGIRLTSVFDAFGDPVQPADDLFATTPDVPAAGFSLYRFSSGHGGLQCSACHGSPHAIYPTSSANDNVQSMQVQGHEGTIVECAACHGPQTLETFDEGPHGMHPTDLWWAKDAHKDAAQQSGLDACRACHGADLRGTVLSRAHADRQWTLPQYGTQSFFRGADVTCYACHDGPDSDDPVDNVAPFVPDAQASTPADLSVALALMGSDPDGDPLVYRVLAQPSQGTVALVGGVATYFPNGAYVGPDAFVVTAFDGSRDAEPATIQVDVLPAACGGHVTPYGFGCPDGDDVFPRLEVTGCAAVGEVVTIALSDGAPGATAQLVFGLGSSTVSLPNGCTLRVAPLLPIKTTVVLDAQGTLSVEAVLPTALAGVTFTMQAFVFDPGAPKGYAGTNGVELSVAR